MEGKSFVRALRECLGIGTLGGVRREAIGRGRGGCDGRVPVTEVRKGPGQYKFEGNKRGRRKWGRLLA